MRRHGMLKRRICNRNFGGKIDITDPCYGRSVWCRMNDVKIKPGNYDCIAWMHPSTFGHKGEVHDDTRVGILGIYLGGIVPKKSEMEEIGEIGVDAGLAGFFESKPDYDDDAWYEFYNKILETDDVYHLNDEGVFSSSGYGDGCYGVYSYEKDGEIVALEIRFI